MNNKIAIGVTALALVGVFVINQESNEQTAEQLPLTDDAQPSISQQSSAASAIEGDQSEAATKKLQQSEQNPKSASSDETEIAQASNKPLPPPPPVGIPPMAAPANGQGVVSHPSHRAPVQAPISQSSPRKE